MTLETIQSLRDLIGYKILMVDPWERGLVRVIASRVDHSHRIIERVFFCADLGPLAVDVTPTDPSASVPQASEPGPESASPTGSAA